MNIPGLGLEFTAQSTAAPSGPRTVKLGPFWEWRFEVGFNSEIKVKLLSGTAEKDGTELAAQRPYRFSGVKTKILTLAGCELQVEGSPDDEFVAEFANPVESPMNAYINLHFKLTALRQRAAAAGAEGPRVLVCGPSSTGKTSVARTLAGYATRNSAQPLFVNADPKEGALSLPGTIGAAVLATIQDVEAVDGWGTTPTSGPSQVPVKLPLVLYYGSERTTDRTPRYRELVSQLAGSATSRFTQDPEVKSSGMIIDTQAVSEKNPQELDNVIHVAEELSANIIIVLGSSRINAELVRRFSTEKTSLGEEIHVIHLDKSEGVVVRDTLVMQQLCEATIKEYFFGTVGQTLSPATQQVEFDSLVIYQLGDDSMYGGADDGIRRTEPTSHMAHYTLAVMYASAKDSPEVIRTASVMGYVYVAEVDKERRKVKILAPVSGRLGDHPLLFGSYPEPFINLLG